MSLARLFQPLPAPGDIVWCHFPNRPELGSPGPKPRPGLVTAVSPTTHEVEICYGTSKKTDKLYPGEFLISEQDPGFSVSGLGCTTKFDLVSRVKVRFDELWFHPAPGLDPHTPAPKLGVMHPSYFPAAKAADDVYRRRFQ